MGEEEGITETEVVFTVSGGDGGEGEGWGGGGGEGRGLSTGFMAVPVKDCTKGKVFHFLKENTKRMERQTKLRQIRIQRETERQRDGGRRNGE